MVILSITRFQTPIFIIIKMNKLISLVSFILLLLVWHAISLNVGNTYIVPSPYQVFRDMIQILTDIGNLIVIGQSLLRLSFSLIIASLTGIVLGFLAAKFNSINQFLKPIISTLRTTPIVAIIIILLILAGRVNSVYIITFLILFPIMYENIIGGVYEIDENIISAFRLEPSSLFQTCLYMYLPLTLPHIKIALLQSVGLGFKVLVMAEFIAQTHNSIGLKLYESSISINYSVIFAWSTIIIILAIMIEIGIHKIKSI